MEPKINECLICDEQQIKIRKCRNEMTNAGFTIIAFLAWSIIKSIMKFCLDTPIHEELVSSFDNTSVKVFTIVIISSILIIDFFIRFYVAKSVIAESRGVNVGNRYIFWSIVLIVFSVITLYSLLNSIIVGGVENDEIVSLIVEFTICIITVRMLISVFKLRKYEGGK